MTGMKEGAGEDPFAETPDSSADESDGRRDDDDRRTDSTDRRTTTGERERDDHRQAMDIPYKFRRDSVQDDRERVPLFLMEETKAAEREGLRELEDRFNDDVSLTDLREAVVRVGLEHTDEVERQLEEWGYGMTFGSE